MHRHGTAGSRALGAVASAVLLLTACGGGEPDEAEALGELPLVAAVAALPAGTIQLQEQAGGECLAPSSPAAAGVALLHTACASAVDPVFRLVPIKSGSASVRIQHAASSLCVTVADASRAAGAGTVLADCGGGASQVFATRADGQGRLLFTASHSKLCLEAGEGGALTQQRCDTKFRRLGQLFAQVAAAAPAPAPTPSPSPSPSPAPTRWQPQLSDTWQWQLTGTINTSYNVTVYDIDLFETPQSVIDGLKAGGRRVVCYFSAGSSEDWRSDFSRFTAADLGNNLDGWAGERWLDTRSANVREIMKSRLDLAAARGCDGVEPDNMDGYTNNPGFPLTAQTQVDYARFIAAEARARGLAVGLKNAVDLLADLAGDFDFAVNEQCHQYDECGGYTAFTSLGKPVFNAEYDRRWVTDATRRAQLCAASRAANLRTLVLPLGLDDSFRYSCD